MADGSQLLLPVRPTLIEPSAAVVEFARLLGAEPPPPRHQGSQWTGHEADLANAVGAAKDASRRLRPLADFAIPRMPCNAAASSTIKRPGEPGGSRVIRLAEALGHVWVSSNSRSFINSVTTDLDHLQWRGRLAEWRDFGGPEPIITGSPWKGTVHPTWFLDRPFCLLDPRQEWLYRGVRLGLDAFWGGDRQFANQLRKNPWAVTPDGLPSAPGEGRPGDEAFWEGYVAAGEGLVYHTEFEGALEPVDARALFDLLLRWATPRGVRLLSGRKPEVRRETRAAADGRRETIFVRLPSAPVAAPGGARKAPAYVPAGLPAARKAEAEKWGPLFNAARVMVYRAQTDDADTIRNIVTRAAAAIGVAPSARSVAELTATYSRFMREDWWGPLNGRPGRGGEAAGQVGRKPVNHGVMTAEAVRAGAEALAEWRAKDVTERRVAAAERTHGVVRRASDAAVRIAVGELVAAGLPVTGSAVAARCAAMTPKGPCLRTIREHFPAVALAQLAAEARAPGGVQDGLICPCPEGALPPQAALSEEETFSSLPAPLVVASPAEDDSQAAAEADLRDRQVVDAYLQQVARMERRGSEAEVVFPPLPGASLVVREAYRAALKARTEAQRREDNRRRAAAGRQRAVERAEWHAAHVGDEDAWAARLAEIGARKAAAVELAIRQGAVADRLERIDQAYGAVFGAEHRARRAAQGKPDHAGSRRRKGRLLSEAELAAIPW